MVPQKVLNHYGGRRKLTISQSLLISLLSFFPKKIRALCQIIETGIALLPVTLKNNINQNP